MLFIRCKYRFVPCLGAVAAAAMASGVASAGPETAGPAELEEIVVTASLRQESLADFPVSTTVLDSPVLDAAGVRHFEDAMKLVPNLNWSGATSRPRYFQVRGIGELEQYQGAPNASVGFLVTPKCTTSCTRWVGSSYVVGRVVSMQPP